MDKAAQKASKVLGSAWVVIPFGVWMLVHNLFPFLYVNFISDVAIFIGLLILRAEDVQATRMEDYIKETRKFSKQDLEATKRLEKLLKLSK